MSEVSRVWYQSFVDPFAQRPYMSRLQALLDAYAGPGMRFEVHGIDPPDRYLSPLTEMRCAGQAVRNAIEAQRDRGPRRHPQPHRELDRTISGHGHDRLVALGEVGLDESGALALTGTRRFWTAALADSGEMRSDDEARELSEGDRPDFVWL